MVTKKRYKMSKRSNRKRSQRSKRSNRKMSQRSKRSNRKRSQRKTYKKGGMFKSKKSSLQSILDKQDRETVALISKKRAEHSRSEREGKHPNIPLYIWNLKDDKFKLFYNQCNIYFTITNDMSSRGFFLELKNQSNNLANVHYHIFVDEGSVYPKIQLTSRCPDEEPSGQCESGIRQSSGKIWKHGCHLLVKNAIAGDYTKRWKWDLHYLLVSYWDSGAGKENELNNLFELLQNLLLKANDTCNEVCATTSCGGHYR